MRRTVVAALVSLATAIGASAESPDVARGIAPGKTYHVFGIDTINTYNGNLSLRIPVAPGAPVGPFLTQQLTLAYNSKLYDYQYTQFQNHPEDSVEKRRAVLEEQSNAGLGWSLSLGRLLPPQFGTATTAPKIWRYVAPDGAAHDFGIETGDVAEARTVDSSFLRVRRYPATGPVDYREIEFPDGSIHRFNPDGFVTEIRDRAGYWIRVDYGDPSKWTITSGFAQQSAFRTAVIHFEQKESPFANFPYRPNLGKVVASIEYPAFGGDTATVVFAYDQQKLKYDGCGDYISADPTEYAATLLKSVTLPDGSQYEFTYSQAPAISCTTGIVQSMKLPTGGKIAWKHGAVYLPQEECVDFRGWKAESVGVHTRTLMDASDAEVGSWTYTVEDNSDPNDRSLVACGIFDGYNMPYGPRPVYVKTTVVPQEPALAEQAKSLGKTEHYFETLTGHAGAPTIPWATGSRRLLSTKQFDRNGVLQRSTYVTYRRDGVYPVFFDPSVSGETTVYVTDTGCGGAACYVDVDRSEYDGFGHFRKSLTTSNFGPAKTSFTNYQPNATTWILGNYDYATVQEGTQTLKQEFSFDASGILRYKRTLANGVESSAEDLLEITCRDQVTAYVTHEKFLFAGNDTFSDATPCSATPEAGESQIDHVWTMAAGAPVQHKASYSGGGFYIPDEDYDVTTGLVSRSRDAAGVQTSFDYDALGRVIEETPTGRARTKYRYTSPNELRVERRSADDTQLLRWAKFEYDDFGWLVGEWMSMPDGKTSRRDTTPNILGWKLSVSELVDSEATNPPVTTFSYDPFGRATEVEAPDLSTTKFKFSGVRVIERSTSVKTPSGAGDSTTTETYDAHGRLVSVAEPSGALGAITTTSYTYDAANKLTGVTAAPQQRTFAYDGRGFLLSEDHPEMNAITYTHDARGKVLTKTVTGAPNLDLKFTYDGSERLETVEGRVPGTAVEPGQYRILKQFQFDNVLPAGNKGLGKLWKAIRFNYPAPNDTGEIIRVTETCSYEDDAGRRTARETAIDEVASAAPGAESHAVVQPIKQSQTYDDLDLDSAITYPKCNGCGTSVNGGSRTITFGYDEGRIKSVPGFVTNTTYHPNGMWHERTHANSVEDTQELAPDAAKVMARPHRLVVTGTTNCPVFTAQPASRMVRAGSPVSLQFAATGAATYALYEMGATTPTATSTTGMFDIPQISEAKAYFCRVTSQDGCAITSQTVAIDVCNDVTITLPLDDATTFEDVPKDTELALSVAAEGANIAYEWTAHKDGDEPPGTVIGTTAAVTWTATEGLWTISVTITGNCAGAPSSVTRVVRKVRVVKRSCPKLLTPFPPTIRISSARQRMEFDIILDLEGWATDVEVRRQYSFTWIVDGRVQIENMPGASRYSVLVGDGKTVKMILRGTCGTADYAIIRETFVFHPDTCPVPKISIDQLEVTPYSPQPSFTVSSPWPGLSYQWYRGDSGNTRYPVKQGATLVVSAATPATYWVRATLTRCGSYADSPTLTVSTASCSPLRIVQQPKPGEIAAGEPYTLSFETTTAPAIKSVTWYSGHDELTSTVVGHGLTKVVQPSRTTSYWARIETLGCGSYDTAIATVRVTSCDAIAVTEEPVAHLTFNEDVPESRMLSIRATSAHALQYEWFEGVLGDTRNPRGTGHDLVISNGGVSTQYWVRVTAGNICSIDRVIKVTVCEPFGIVLQPFGAINPAKFIRWIGVDASGSALAYQWFIKSADGTLSPMPGETAAETLVGPEETTRYVVRVTTSCGATQSVDSEPAVMSIPPVLTSTVTGGEVTKGSRQLLTASATGTYLRRQWYRGDGDTQPVAGATGETFLTPELHEPVTYWARVWSGEAYVDTTAAQFTICQPRAIVASGSTGVAGQPVTLFVQSPGENETFEWYEGESGDVTKLVNTGTNLPVSPAVTTKYWLRTKRSGCHADSAAYAVTICTARIDTQPAATMADPGGTAKLSVTTTGHPSMTYQWYEGARLDVSRPVAGGTSRELTTPALNAPTSYWVRITTPSAPSCTTSVVDSLAAAVSICQRPAFTSEPVDLLRTGATVKLTSGATGTEAKFQWYRMNGTTPVLISGATSNELTVGPSETTNYFVRVSGRCGSIDSRIAKVSVAPAITDDPDDVSITNGTATTLSVAATGTERTYQWYGASGLIAGQTSDRLTTPPLTADTTYYVRVFSGQAYTDSRIATVRICQPRRALVTQSAQTAGAQVYLDVEAPGAGETFEWYELNASGGSVLIGTGTRVTRTPVATTRYWVRTKRAQCDADSAVVTAVICAPSISVNPANTSAIAGQPADFAVTAVGPGLTYQWYRGASGNTMNPVVNQTGSTLRVWPAATEQYWVRVTTPTATGCGIANFVNSTAATVTVCQPASITADPVNENVSYLQTHTLSVTATGTVTSYQWYEGRKGVTTKPVGTNSRLLTVQGSGTKYYWVQVNGACGSDQSEEALVSVIPTFAANPVSASACSGRNAAFSATAQGDPATITYQWYAQLAGSSTAQVVGTNSPTLSIAATGEMTVWAVATSGNSSVSSACATLTVSTNPLVYRTEVVRMANGAYYLLYAYVHEDERPDVQYAWYTGNLGDTTTQIGWSDNTSVSPATRPARYWVRVTNVNTGCYTDTAVVVQ